MLVTQGPGAIVTRPPTGGSDAYWDQRPGITTLDENLGMRPGVLLATGLALRDLPERGPWT